MEYVIKFFDVDDREHVVRRTLPQEPMPGQTISVDGFHLTVESVVGPPYTVICRVNPRSWQS